MPTFYVFTFTVYLILALSIGVQYIFSRNRTFWFALAALLIYALSIPLLFLAINFHPSALLLFPMALIASTGLLLYALANKLNFSKPFLYSFVVVLSGLIVFTFSFYKIRPLFTVQISLIISGAFLLFSTLGYWLRYQQNDIPGLRGLVVSISFWSMGKVIAGIGIKAILINPGIVSSIAVGLDGLLGFWITMSAVRAATLKMGQQQEQRLREFSQATTFLGEAGKTEQFSALLENICRAICSENSYQLVMLDVNNIEQTSRVFSSNGALLLDANQIEAITGEKDTYLLKQSETLHFLREHELAALKNTRDYLPGVREVACLKVRFGADQQGTLYIYKSSKNWSQLEQVMLEAYASLAGILLHNYQTTMQMHESISTMIATLSTAVDARDSYTANHSMQVAAMGTMLAEQMMLPLTDQETLSTAGLLHDIGKIGIPDRVLLKTQRLNDNEYSIIKQHPRIGANILAMAPQVFSEVLPVVAAHHERWDGNGYPNGLRGENIPLLARILTVADSLDAMVSDRVYRPGIQLELALQEIRRGTGTQFDPSVVEALNRIYESDLNELDSWTRVSKSFNQTA